MQHWALLLIVTFLAATVQSATGFGFGLIAVSAFLIMLNSVAAIQLVIIITLVMSCAHWPVLRGIAPTYLLKWLAFGCTLGFPLGLLLYQQLDLTAIKAVVAVLIILISLQTGWQLLRKAKTSVRHAYHQGTVVAVGAAAGLMASSMAMPGSPVMLYLSRTALSKDEIRATILTFFIFSYGGALLVQAVWVGIELQTWLSALVLIPIALSGVFVGNLVSKKINPLRFKVSVLMILLLTGFFMLFNL